MEETIENVEIAIGRKLTAEELRVVKIAHMVAYVSGANSVWDMVRSYKAKESE